jgi:protein N-terminal methyltransferase
VELLEPVGSFLSAARETLPSARLRATHEAPLQGWTPPEGSAYAVIWIQWVISYLDDLEAVGVLERCAAALIPGGCLVLKESVANAQRGFFADESDGSLIRTDAQFRQLFQKAKLTLARGERMSGLPQGVFAVHMYALRPQANPQL